MKALGKIAFIFLRDFILIFVDYLTVYTLYILEVIQTILTTVDALYVILFDGVLRYPYPH